MDDFRLESAFSDVPIAVHTRVRNTLQEVKTVKKTKPISTLALAAVLIMALATTSALAAMLISYSDQANAVNLARESLYEKYDLTPQTLGLFHYDIAKENGVYTVTWTSSTFHPGLTGAYTTVIQNGKADASWTYDDVDGAVYASGNLSAPVWGQKQLAASFLDKETADEYSLARWDTEASVSTPSSAVPEATHEIPAAGERYWNGEILVEAEPRADALRAEQAYAIAAQAFDTGFDIDIAQGGNFDQCFLLRKNGGALWEITFYVSLVTSDASEAE